MAKIVPSGIPCALGVRPKTGLAVLVVLAVFTLFHGEVLFGVPIAEDAA